jgi:hypothetical protein
MCAIDSPANAASRFLTVTDDGSWNGLDMRISWNC